MKLVENLCQKGMTIEEAIDEAVAEVGPEPFHDTQIKCYPKQSESTTITEYIR